MRTILPLSLILFAVVACNHSPNVVACGQGGCLPRETQIESVVVGRSPVEVLPVPIPLFEATLPYPLQMREAGIIGIVIARIAIDEHGRVRNVAILRSSMAEFEPPVIHCVSRTRFIPARVDNKAVECTVDYEFKFHFAD